MRTPTDSRTHQFQAVDARLVPYVFSIMEQRSLRLLAALLLAGYSVVKPGPLLSPAWIGVLIPSLYAVLQLLLALIEARRGPRAWLSAVITTLDLVLLGFCLFNDPSASTPTLLLLVLLPGLAGMRHRPSRLLATLLLGLLTASLALAARSFLTNSYPHAMVPTAIATLLLLGLGAVLWRHTRRLRLQVERTIAEDPATGLGNRWTLYAAAQMLWPLAHRQQLPVTLMYVVIEPTGLKKGREPGPALIDQLAGEFARVAQSRLRGSDILVRYSPLEFVFMLIDCPGSQADPIALHLQEHFHRWSQDAGVPATAHVGATWLPASPLALDELLDSMDAALHRARQHRLGVSGAVYADPEHVRSGIALS